MKKIKVLSVFGTRPEATKMAPLIKKMATADWLESKVCVTGQHREMLDQVLDLFKLDVDYDLNIMRQNQTLVDIMSRTLVGFDAVLDKESPDLVLVHGDTSTAFAAAFTAYNKQYAVGHVEAGLRSRDKWSPFPEEMNRRLIDTVADLFFAPTEQNKQNLIDENIAAEQIYVTGNTSIDAIKWVTAQPYQFDDARLNDIVSSDQRLIVVTAHRRENLGDRMRGVFNAIKRLVETYDDIVVVYPVHLNPKVQVVANEVLAGVRRVHLIDPLAYKPFAHLMAHAHLILTDSGGLQEEAPALDKPVVVLRTETERPEALAAGTIVLAGVEPETIFQKTCQILNDQNLYRQIASAKNPYGDGTACAKIIVAIKDWAFQSQYD
ncbi:MAG: UDP-N-acetylglucosamine 2-epimerase (non-hydrolyzing) [Clostridiales bacterium]|nr:MAG: UDP-N-acetylglucosamine 2-epimerase (non-hydrolyzing) [Clostridiales bacterium]